MRHTPLVVFAVIASLAVSPLRAQTPPPPENLAAARELVQAMKATDQFMVLLPAILQALKPAFVQNRPDVEKDFDAILPIINKVALQRLSGLADALADIYARNFSVAEIHDLTAFYRSPTGQALIARQPVIARESLMAGQQWAQSLTADLKEEIANEMRKREHAN